MYLSYEKYFEKVKNDISNESESIERKVYELISCYFKTNIIPTEKYKEYITLGIINRYYMYKDVYPKISTSEDSFTSYAIKDNNGYYNLEDFLLNRLFNNLKKVYINHDPNANTNYYQTRNKAIYFTHDALSKYIVDIPDIPDNINEYIKKYFNMFIAQVFDHELGHALKIKCSNGISIYHDNRNLLYEKLSDVLEKNKIELLEDISLERIKSDNEIFMDILHDLRTIYNNKYNNIIKNDNEINFNVGLNNMSLQKYEYINELFQEVESRYNMNSFDEPNCKKFISVKGSYLNITRPFSVYSAIYNYGDIMLSLIGLKDFFQINYLDSTKVLQKFNKDYKRISKSIFNNNLSAINNINITLEKIINNQLEKDYLKLDLFLTKCYEQKIDEILKSKISIEKIDKLIIDTSNIISKLTLNKSTQLEHTVILKNILNKLIFKKSLLQN